MAETFFKYANNLFIQDNSDPYRKEVERYLNLIRTTHAGITLIDFLGKSPRQRAVRIVPFKPKRGNMVNASANSNSAADVFAKGTVVMRPIRVPGNTVVMVPTATLGTGRGTDVRVEYHPATWRQLNINMHGIAPGAGPGEVLFHELIHAMRMAWGRYIRTSVVEHMHMDDLEEFCAIVAAAIYRSERGFKIQRMDHKGNKPLTPNLSDSESYYKRFERPIDQWFASQKDFCLELAASPAKFNPLRVAAGALGLLLRTGMALPD